MSDEEWYTPAKTVLLTGAGFTKNFGGYLGSEMWGKILNQPEVQSDSGLRKLMLANLNFESVYELVLTSSDYSAEQQRALTIAIRRAFEEMDSVVQEIRPGDRSAEDRSACKNFIRLFADSKNPRTRGFVFTLNQDIFLERYYASPNNPLCEMQIPGISHKLWFRSSAEPANRFEVRLPDARALENYKEQFKRKGTGQFMYVKLHGSYGWLLDDGSNVMVIGEGKRGRIQTTPLLEWYLQIFKRVLNAGSQNLVTLGYGFGDDHINEIIAQAINDAGLRLHIINPMDPEAFRDSLLSAHAVNQKLTKHGQEIWDGIWGYYQNRVTELYGDLPYHLFPSAGQHFIRNLRLA